MQTNQINDLAPNAETVTQGPLTVGVAAATLLSLVSGNAFNARTTMVMLSVETDSLRLTLDGTAPTATKGHLINPGKIMMLTRAEADAAKMIRVTTDSKIQVSEYRAA